MSAKKILLVDDDLAFCNSLQGALTDRGYNVVTAGSVVEAGQLLADKSIALVICDYDLKGDLGTSLAGNMHKKADHRPFILMSGDPEIGNFPHIVADSGLQDFWRKQGINRLLSMISRYIKPIVNERTGLE